MDVLWEGLARLPIIGGGYCLPAPFGCCYEAALLLEPLLGY